MPLMELDSRSGLGSDVERIESEEYRRGFVPYPQLREVSALSETWMELTVVRVILGRLGTMVRLSAPSLGVMVEDPSFELAWQRFLASVAERPDSHWLTFDLAPTRPEELEDGLDVPPDECWGEPPDPDST